MTDPAAEHKQKAQKAEVDLIAAEQQQRDLDRAGDRYTEECMVAFDTGPPEEEAA